MLTIFVSTNCMIVIILGLYIDNEINLRNIFIVNRHQKSYVSSIKYKCITEMKHNY